MNIYRHKGTHPGGPDAPLEGRLLGLARRAGVLRSRDLAAERIPRMILTRLLKRNLLTRAARGLYVLPDADVSEHHTLAEASKRVPQGVICLLSALRFHGLTTQSPFEVWMAVDVKARKPRLDAPPLRIVRFSGQALSHGVEEHSIDHVPVRVTSAPKTVADCFKYRRKIGLDVALEVLKDYRRARKSMDELWKAARVCRVASVIRPYLEALE